MTQTGNAQRSTPLFDAFACVIVMACVAVLWQGAVMWFDTPQILLPSPIQVTKTAWQEGSTLAAGFARTTLAAILGLCGSSLIGFAIAILFSQSGLARKTLYPYVVFLQTVPIVAIAPLLITWCGYTFMTVVLVAGIISLFPIISNVTTGLISVDPNLLDLFRLQNATRMQTLVKLQIPSAMQGLVDGLRVSAGLAVIGAVVGEFFVGPGMDGAPGLGSLMTVWQTRARTDALIAAVLASTLLGLIILVGTNTLARLLLKPWLRELTK